MHKLNSKLLLAAALSAALLAGCGGGSSSSTDGSSAFGTFPVAGTPVTPGSPGTPGTPGTPGMSDLAQNIAAVFEYISRLIASNSENSDPVNINVLTLATDETSSPTPLP